MARFIYPPEAGGGGSTPGGSTGDVQYNDGGAFGGDSSFFWDDANKRLGIGTSTPVRDVDIFSPAGEPTLLWTQDSQTANNKRWQMTVSAGDWYLQALDDSFSGNTAIRANRTGTTVDNITFGAEIIIPNNTFLFGRNSTDTTDLKIAKITNTDTVEIGDRSGTGTYLELYTNGITLSTNSDGDGDMYMQANNYYLGYAGGVTAPKLKFSNADESFYVDIKAPDALAGSYTLTLPDADGTAGQVLSTDGAGVLSFSSPGGSPEPLTEFKTLAAIQEITFDIVPTVGSFEVDFNASGTPAVINFNDNDATVAASINAIPGLATATVTGSPATLITVTFMGSGEGVALLTIANNTTDAVPTVTETQAGLQILTLTSAAFNSLIMINADQNKAIVYLPSVIGFDGQSIRIFNFSGQFGPGIRGSNAAQQVDGNTQLDLSCTNKTAAVFTAYEGGTIFTTNGWVTTSYVPSHDTSLP